MSSLDTLSIFYFGTTVTNSNCRIPFSEDGGVTELVATLRVGDYSATEYVAEWARAMTLAGAFDYTASFNRANRKMTIVGTGVFQLLSFTGTVNGTAAWEMGGWDLTADYTGASTYTSLNGVGSEYRPQYLLSDYTSPEDFRVKEASAVNVSTAGVVQTLTFGDGRRVRMNIVLITNKINLVQSVFYSNAQGLNDAYDFMDYLITKAKVEFMPDVADRNTFYKLILESTKADRDGTAYELQNMSKAKDVYMTGELFFRKALA